MKPSRMLDCGPALFGGYRVALLCGLRCEGQALFETANDVAACAALMGLTVLTCDETIIQACTALGVETALPPRFDRKRWRYEEWFMITLLHGDCTDLLQTLVEQSIQCLITSPPYFGLRDYDIPPTHWPEIAYAPMAGLPTITIEPAACCLGLEDSPLAFIGHLLHVFRLARPALRDDGVCWVNLGDSYAQPSKWGGRSGNKNRPNDLNRYPRRRLRLDSGLKDKDLYGMPWRLALALQADGWYLRSDVIWEKPNGMCESVTDRPTRSHEYLFLLAKSKDYYYDADAIREPLRPKTLTTYGTKHRAQGNDAGGNVKSDNWGRTVKERKPRLLDDGTPAGANKRAIWRISSAGAIEDHYATFPEALIEPCILAGSRAGDAVLDPFMGSGTVGRVAERLQRHAIGIDLAYQDVQAKRTDKVQVEMFV